MVLGVWNQEWLAQNATRRYPLADDADGVDTTGTFRLPNDFLVELDLPVHAGLDVSPAGFFVRSVAAFAGGYGLVVAYAPEGGGRPVDVATALVTRDGGVRNRVFTLGGVGDFADTVGKVVIGRLDGIDAQPPGFWEFTLESARLDPDAVRPIVRGVSSVVCVNGGQRSLPLYGDVELVAGHNMRITPVVRPGQDPVVRFDAVSGEGTVEKCVCDEGASAPVTRINGVAPTAAGDFVVVGNDCVQVEAIPHGIRIKDVCAQPCCGREELERITRDLERLAGEAAAVEQFVGRLRSAVDTMSLVVLGSRLNDRGCGPRP